MQIVRGHSAALLNPFNRELTMGQRWCFVTGWLPWVGDALGLAFLVMGLAWSIGLVVAPMRFEFPIVLFHGAVDRAVSSSSWRRSLRSTARRCRAAGVTGWVRPWPGWR